jgi:hypothetical protein
MGQPKEKEWEYKGTGALVQECYYCTCWATKFLNWWRGNRSIPSKPNQSLPACPPLRQALSTEMTLVTEDGPKLDPSALLHVLPFLPKLRLLAQKGKTVDMVARSRCSTCAASLLQPDPSDHCPFPPCLRRYLPCHGAVHLINLLIGCASPYYVPRVLTAALLLIR